MQKCARLELGENSSMSNRTSPHSIARGLGNSLFTSRMGNFQSVQNTGRITASEQAANTIRISRIGTLPLRLTSVTAWSVAYAVPASHRLAAPARLWLSFIEFFQSPGM